MAIREEWLETDDGVQHGITFYGHDSLSIRIAPSVVLCFEPRAMVFMKCKGKSEPFFIINIGITKFTELTFYVTEAESDRLRKIFKMPLKDTTKQ